MCVIKGRKEKNRPCLSAFNKERSKGAICFDKGRKEGRIDLTVYSMCCCSESTNVGRCQSVDITGMLKTDCFGRTRLALHLPSSL